jgi:hypothetical protein
MHSPMPRIDYEVFLKETKKINESQLNITEVDVLSVLYTTTERTQQGVLNALKGDHPDIEFWEVGYWIKKLIEKGELGENKLYRKLG